MKLDNPYLLLTPGPVTTSPTVRAAMASDCCTWISEYSALVDDLRRRLVRLATARDGCVCVLLQGTGSYAVEAALGTAVPPDGKLLIVDNGAYGRRLVTQAERLRIPRVVLEFPETEPADPGLIDRVLRNDPAVTTVAMVHSETTTGLLNPAAEVGRVVNARGRTYIVDAVSSFAGLPFTMEELGAHYLVSTSGKCLQGVPGVGVVIAREAHLAGASGWARSLSFDLYDQWQFALTSPLRWRFTSPTHAVRALAQAVAELEEEGGLAARHCRYQANQRTLLAGMEALGFVPLLPSAVRTPILTSFRYPSAAGWSMPAFYEGLKKRGFVLFPGKVSQADAFRIGTIGHVFPEDYQRLTAAVAEVIGQPR
jgi:2-aminoethylphosphonate-pyruvate transaminase